ncbi:YjbG polysaccharide synthesis-related protein [Vibrio sp. CAU 1672]|uniref:YjbG polysaccharide synthesis-related protein n=1 Tax=Vibrio sp. CAU 1672 TaxID=3032594 RepID=UPI0031F40656
MQASQGNGLSLSYPIATTLFDESKTAKQQSETLKNAVLNQMMQHNLVSHPLYKFIKQQQFAPRLMSELDLDKVRLDKFNNPLLHGTLSLASPERNQYVFYLGNTNTVHKIKSQQGVSLYQQLDNLEPVIGRVAQSPVIIYPNGQVVLPHDGAWLTTQYYLPPLTMVYLPFERYTESELDQNIVSLLAQLKLTQR